LLPNFAVQIKDKKRLIISLGKWRLDYNVIASRSSLVSRIRMPSGSHVVVAGIKGGQET
jgi:hypothetical protein